MPSARLLRVLLGSRIRSQLSYRSNFGLTTFTAFLLGMLEFLEIYLLLANAPTLGGLDLEQAALVFAFANLSFSVAELLIGQVDRLPVFIREGTLDVLLVRPTSLLVQIVTADFQLRRLGRSVFALLLLVLMLGRLRPDLTPGNVYLVLTTPVYGTVIYCCLFVLVGGIQFWLIDGTEFINSFVYGSAYAGQLPGSVLRLPLQVLFTFVLPATVVAYAPVIQLLGLPGSGVIPPWIGWCAPALAVVVALAAALVWSGGVRRYTGAGG